MHDQAAKRIESTEKKYKQYFQSPIRIVHVTPSLTKIKNTKKIFPSGGGLGAVIYGVPLDRNLHPHNLFQVFYSYQIPKKTKKVDILLFEITPKKGKFEEWGVDYTTFGNVHLKTWEKIKKKKIVSKKYQQELENRVMKQVDDNAELIYSLMNEKKSNKEFEKEYSVLFSNIPALRFIIYEILCEYILLFQNESVSRTYLKKNELYNLNHKKMVFDLCPTMSKKFNMASFYIPMSKMVNYIKKKKIIEPFEVDAFYSFFEERIAFYLHKVCPKKINMKNSYRELAKNNPDLLGHLLYREFFDKTLFEQNLSEFILKDYQKRGIICPIYSILPKGEVGINPYCREMGALVTIRLAHYNKRKNIIKAGRKLNISIEKSIIARKENTIR